MVQQSYQVSPEVVVASLWTRRKEQGAEENEANKTEILVTSMKAVTGYWIFSSHFCIKKKIK